MVEAAIAQPYNLFMQMLRNEKTRTGVNAVVLAATAPQ